MSDLSALRKLAAETITISDHPPSEFMVELMRELRSFTLSDDEGRVGCWYVIDHTRGEPRVAGRWEHSRGDADAFMRCEIAKRVLALILARTAAPSLAKAVEAMAAVVEAARALLAGCEALDPEESILPQQMEVTRRALTEVLKP